MPENRANQSGASAGGDVVGRDKHTHFHESRAGSPLRSILERLAEERVVDGSFDRLIDELQHFCSSVDGAGPIGLEAKLLDGRREDLLPLAVREKELFAKRLAEHQLWRSAQDLYAYMLGRVRDRFQASIWPLLNAGSDCATIDAALVVEVIEPCLSELDHNPLGISSTHLRGMVYFLTGNCFLKWKAS